MKPTSMTASPGTQSLPSSRCERQPVRGLAVAAICGAALALTLFVAVVSRAADSDATLKAGTFDPPRDAPELSLAGSDGQPLSLARFRGRVVVVEFGFTSCPNVCPATL